MITEHIRRAHVRQKLSWLMEQVGMPAAFRRGARRRVAILCYHRLTDGPDYFLPGTPIETFRDHMAFLVRHYRVLALADVVRAMLNGKTLPPNTAVVTFDDGYRSVSLLGRDVLRAFHIPATVYLPWALIDGSRIPWWDQIYYVFGSTTCDELEFNDSQFRLDTPDARRNAARTCIRTLKPQDSSRRDALVRKLAVAAGVDISAIDPLPLLLSWKEIERLGTDGVSFGAHTLTHPILTSISPENARREIVQGRALLRDRISTTAFVDSFAYPNGSYSPVHAAMCEFAGYSSAVTCRRSLATARDKIYELPRFVIGNQSVGELALDISGILPTLRRVRGRTSEAVNEVLLSGNL
jgi:peptidoglycan/xylan/chitin deacetylase (PgdA/CDA1 family)